MPGLWKHREQLLKDNQITEDEVQVIRDYIEHDGQLDIDDIKFLVGLLSESREVCPAFDELFFPAFKQVILDDGKLGDDERFYLLKMLYSDGRIRESEKQFLVELQQELTEVTPEFESLCEVAFTSPAEGWDVGGR